MRAWWWDCIGTSAHVRRENPGKRKEFKNEWRFYFILPRINNIVIFFLFILLLLRSYETSCNKTRSRGTAGRGLVPELFYGDFTTENEVLCERTKTHNERMTLGNDVAGSEIKTLPNHAVPIIAHRLR